MANEWASEEHATSYLLRGEDWPPHRREGEAVLLELLADRPTRVLDLGCGDGRLLALLGAPGIALDASPPMLAAARSRFADRPDVEVVEHDLAAALPVALGHFDAIVSAFAIHHCTDERKRGLYDEAFSLLEPGGVFANLEHVASPSAALHAAFFAALGQRVEDEDPSNKLADVETQLRWLRQIGFVDVDCLWKWRELALLVGRRSTTP